MRRPGPSLVFLLLATLFFLSWPGGSVSSAKEMIVLNNGLLSVSAKDVSSEGLFTELGRVCEIEIEGCDNSFPQPSISIAFSDAPLEEGIRRIIKRAGVKNYLLRFGGTEDSLSIKEIRFLGCGGAVLAANRGRAKKAPGEQGRPKPSIETPPASAATTSTDVNEHERPRPAAETPPPAETNDPVGGDIDKAISAMEGKYKWDSEKTAKLAMGVLRGAPPQIRKYALESMTNSINSYLKGSGSGVVDKEMVYKAAEQTVPGDNPEIRAIIRGYLGGSDTE